MTAILRFSIHKLPQAAGGEGAGYEHLRWTDREKSGI